MFVRVNCCAGFGMLPIYNQQNRFAVQNKFTGKDFD